MDLQMSMQIKELDQKWRLYTCRLFSAKKNFEFEVPVIFVVYFLSGKLWAAFHSLAAAIASQLLISCFSSTLPLHWVSRFRAWLQYFNVSIL